MPKLDDLRRDRKAAATALQVAADAITALEEAGTASEDEQHIAAVSAFDAAQASFDQINAGVKRAEVAEAAAAASAVGDQGAGAQSGVQRPAVAQNPAEKGVQLGFMVHALARCKGDRDKAASFLDGEGHSGISAALSGATETAGGVTVPRAMATEMIELLRSRVVVRAAGARTFPMPAGQIRHAKQTASATASYAAENAQIAASEPEFGKIDQSFKKLTGLVPVGNSLLRHSGIAMAQTVRDDLLKVMARREDLAFIRGDGSANSPTGIRNWLLAANFRRGGHGCGGRGGAALGCVARRGCGYQHGQSGLDHARIVQELPRQPARRHRQQAIPVDRGEWSAAWCADPYHQSGTEQPRYGGR